MACVYILRNPAIPDLVKIGYTAGTAADRAAQISQGTGVPAPYSVEWYCETTTAETAHQLEQQVHAHCAAHRVNAAREFFQMTVPAAAAVIESLGYRAGMIAITSPEVAARAAAEQERARAEAAERAEQERVKRAAAQAKRDEELRIQRQREDEQNRINRISRAENKQTAFWVFVVALLLLLTPVFFISFPMFVLAWMLNGD